MRAKAIDAAVAAANPVPNGTLDAARVAAVGTELIDAIAGPSAAHSFATANAHPLATAHGDSLAEGRAEAPRTAHRSARRSPLHGPRARSAVVAATGAAALAAIVVVVLGTNVGGGSRPRRGPSYAPVLMRYAANSPLLLLAPERWHASYVFEETAQEGEMHFLLNGASERQLARMAQLNWQAAPLRYEWPGWTLAEVLGAGARIYKDGSEHGRTTYIAVWRSRGLWLSFRATTRDVAAFRTMLSGLRRVDERAWLAALPPSVIRAAERPSTVSGMLAGIPLPPGFDASRIPGAGLTENRYQLGATVAGAVACTWFQIWAEGRARGDAQQVRTAVAAMATASRWPVLRAMRSEGGYPQVLEEFAADMPSGAWYGHPLAAAVAPGLGCAERGVTIPGARSVGRSR